MKITLRLLVLFAAVGIGIQGFNLPAPPTPIPGVANLPAPPTPIPGAQAV
ncbi:MAG TPA: hypothetical protein VJV96_12745 [Candidatus Angelobacter sp.]|nr:hypothetical protein [Candidatus Angelobacter sp.]